MKLGRIISTFLKGYHPNEYWEKRGKVYLKEHVPDKFYYQQEKELVNYLKGINFDSVLEVGCGFGRITHTILSNFPEKKYVAIDLSEDQINNAKKLCKDFENIEFIQSTIQDFKTTDKFDLVLGAEVLLHVPSDEIVPVIKKLVGHSNHHIINIDFNSKNIPKFLLPHNFVHNYKELYSNDSRINEVVEIPINEKQSIYHAKKD